MPERASSAQQDEIRGKISLAELALTNEVYKGAQKTRIKLEQHMKFRDEDGKLILERDKNTRKLKRPPVRPSEIKKLSREQQEQYSQAMLDVAKYQQRAQRLYNEAIQMTLDYYKISPNKKSGPIKSGPPPNPRYPDAPKSHLGEQADWKPHFSSDRLDPKESDAGLMGTAAFTRHDGSVAIRHPAFEYPGKLALILYHESFHFDEFLSGDNIDNNPASEIRARERERPLLELIFQLQAKDIKRHAKVLADNIALKPKWDQLIKDGFSPYIHPNAFPSIPQSVRFEDEILEPVKQGSETDFLDSVERLREIAREAREIAEERRRGDEQRRQEERESGRRAEERREQERGERRRIRNAAKEDAWKYLRTLAGLACSDPDALRKEEDDGRVLAVGLSKIELVMKVRTQTRGPGSLNSCQQYVLEEVIQTKKPVLSSDIERWGRAYRKANPGLIGKFITSLRDLLVSNRKLTEVSPPPAPEEREREARRPASERNVNQGPRCYWDAELGAKVCCAAFCD